jgi:hypothetical protein
MLYCHYQMLDIGGIEMMKLVFSSQSRHANRLLSHDFETAKPIIHLIKQIPSAKRNYDPIWKVWTIPATHFSIIIGLVPQGNDIQHTNLDEFINPPIPEQKKWYDNANIKAESAEDFFHSHSPVTSSLMTETELKQRIAAIIYEVIIPSYDLENGTKQDLLRAYKLAARRLHPDVIGGNAALMSELNSLWMQYKEIAK